MANVFAGTMEDRSFEFHQVTSDALEATNSTTVSELFNSARQLIWPEDIKYDNVL